MLLPELKSRSSKLLFTQYLAEYEVYFYSKGIKCLHGVMRILLNKSLSEFEKFHVDFTNFSKKRCFII